MSESLQDTSVAFATCTTKAPTRGQQLRPQRTTAQRPDALTFVDDVAQGAYKFLVFRMRADSN